MQDGRGADDTPQRIRPNVALVLLACAAVTLAAGQSFAGIATYAADCITPKTTFNLGDTVCVKATGLIGFRLQWVDADGFAVVTNDLMNDPQVTSFVLPSTDRSAIGGFFSANNLGRWRANAVTSRNSVTSAGFFTVKDPKNPVVDLSVVKSLIGGTIPNAGDAIQFAVTVTNNGPDDAVNAHFVDNVFSNALFNSLMQTSGPAFVCSGADCHLSTFPNGAAATFVLNFTAGGSFGVLTNTATISSDTPELNPTDNSASSAPVTVGTTGPLPTCNLVVSAPPSVTLFTGPGATSCGVTVLPANLDTVLGTASATDNCPLSGTISRTGVPSGNVFPVGVTVVTYSAKDTDGNTVSAIQQVKVIDNTPPVISCPASITLDPTCAIGAVATWTAPTGTDNCPGATTVQTAGPGNGSVFPIGTTPVTYTVTDGAGNQASCSFTVTVLTPTAAIQRLETSVNASSLNGPQKQGLLPKLDAALAALHRANTNAACGSLTAFVNAVQSLVAAGNISAAQGQAWINSATHVGNAIGCTNNPCT